MLGHTHTPEDEQRDAQPSVGVDSIIAIPALPQVPTRKTSLQPLGSHIVDSSVSLSTSVDIEATEDQVPVIHLSASQQQRPIEGNERPPRIAVPYQKPKPAARDWRRLNEQRQQARAKRELVTNSTAEPSDNSSSLNLRDQSQPSPTTYDSESPALNDENMDESVLLDPKHLNLCITSYPYTADKNDELSFVEGQVIRVVRKVAGGWWEGQLDHRVGWFPANHVDKYSPTPDDIAEENIGPFVNTMDELDELRLRTILLNNQIQGVDNTADTKPGIPISAEVDDKRLQMLQALSQAERAHYESLERFMHEFVYPLQYMEWFPADDHQSIFGNLGDLVDFERDLVATLEHALTNQQLVGQSLLELSDRLSDVYTEYCVNLPHAVTVATKYSQNSQMTKFLQTAGANTTPPILYMVSFLHKPAQWKSKYQSNLAHLLDATDASHPDREPLESACKRLSGILNYISRMKRIIENKEIVRNLMKQLDGWDGLRLEVYGGMILQGTLKLQEGVRKRERRFYLLERLLLICRTERIKGGDLKLKVLERLVVSRSQILGVSEDEGDVSGMTFHITYLTDDSRAKTLSITAFNPEQRENWVSALKAQLKTNVSAAFANMRLDTESTTSETDAEKKTGKTPKWFTSWSAKIRKKRPSIPNLREYAEAVEEGRFVEADVGGIRILKKKATRELLKQVDEPSQQAPSTSGKCDPMPNAQTLAGRSLHLANDMSTAELSVLHSPENAEVRQRQSGGSGQSQRRHSGSLFLDGKPGLNKPASDAPPLPPLPANISDSKSRSRIHSGSSLGSIGSAMTLLPTRQSAMGSLRSAGSTSSPQSTHAPSTLADATCGGEVTPDMTSQSSSPASFLWIGARPSRQSQGSSVEQVSPIAPQLPPIEQVSAITLPMVGKSLPDAATSSTATVATLNSSESRANMEIAAPVAKAPLSLSIVELEGQAAHSLDVSRESIVTLLPEADAASADSIFSAVTTTAIQEDAVAQAAEPNLLRTTDLYVQTDHLPKTLPADYYPTPVGSRGSPVTAEAAPPPPMQAQMNGQHRPHPQARAVPVPIATRHSTRPEFASQSRKHFVGHEALAHYDPSTYTPMLAPPQRVEDHSIRSPKRKSSAVNLFGSVRNLFRRSKSSDTLTALHGNQSMIDLREMTKTEGRKGSFVDLKELFWKGRGRSRSNPPDQLDAESRDRPASNDQAHNVMPVQLPEFAAPLDTAPRGSEEGHTARQRPPYACSVQSVPLPSPLPAGPVAYKWGDSGVYGLGSDGRCRAVPSTVQPGTPDKDLPDLPAERERGRMVDRMPVEESVPTEGKSSSIPQVHDMNAPNLQTQSDRSPVVSPRAQENFSCSQPRVLRRVRSNLAMPSISSVTGGSLQRIGSVENFQSRNPAMRTVEEEEEFGPVLGCLEKQWYRDLMGKCESMADEIRTLKGKLQEVERMVAQDERE
ncbi:Rho guanine nucleotide exchange factor 7 [Gaertneriomyces sp. JEL0708]|nr:Rho guanine nucleotide exchange factor 7 [Gaertneriomyces sp. JEL0708]